MTPLYTRRHQLNQLENKRMEMDLSDCAPLSSPTSLHHTKSLSLHYFTATLIVLWLFLENPAVSRQHSHSTSFLSCGIVKGQENVLKINVGSALHFSPNCDPIEPLPVHGGNRATASLHLQEPKHGSQQSLFSGSRITHPPLAPMFTPL